MKELYQHLWAQDAALFVLTMLALITVVIAHDIKKENVNDH